MACWIPKTTDTHSVFNIYCFFHGNNSNANASQIYAIYTMHVLLIPKVTMEDNIVIKSREIWFDEAVLKKLIIS